MQDIIFFKHIYIYKLMSSLSSCGEQDARYNILTRIYDIC
jgi:hypothetical protein